jgi:glucose-6-phosphate isomerase
MAVAGIDVSKVISSAEKALKDLDLRSPENPVWQYAAARQHLYRIGYETELLASFEPSFRFVGEWWKQLFGESEGKDGVGIFPASVEYTADLHSMGQFIQDGPRNLMETVVRFGSEAETYAVPFDEGNADGLNYLAGRDLGEIGKVVADAVRAAHVEGGVPNMVVEIPRRNEEGFAEMVIFFELACGVSGYMSGVNPFNQPGVEAYKKNMFKMLGKPGT